MRPWDPTDTSQVERSRAKKLPCGHILHFGCLKSWLERQQVCPTCRRPVSRDGQQQGQNGGAVVFRLGLNFPAGQNRQAQPPANGQAPGGGGQPAQGGGAEEQGNNQNRNVRMFNFGPLRLGFAQGGVDEIREMAQRLRIPPDAANPPVPTPTAPAPSPAPQEHNNTSAPGLDQMRAQLLALGQQVQVEMLNAHNAAHEVHYLNLLMNELIRLRQGQLLPRGQPQATQQVVPGAVHSGQAPPPHAQQGTTFPFMYPRQQGQPPLSTQMHTAHPFAPRLTRHVGAGNGALIPAGSPELPEGVVIPPGWTLLPLQRADGGVPPADPALLNAQVPAMPPHDVLHSFMPQAPNNPRSRGTSPAPGVGIFGQAARATASTSNTPEPHRAPGAPGPAALDAAASRQQGPPVTAPTPLAPNWGGPAQLFGDRGAPAIFGYQHDHTPEPHDEHGERSGDGPTADTAVNGVVATERSSEPQEEEEVGINGSNESRGGARAVTVEEADDDEDER